jgi:hypothetical protein
MEEPLEEPVEPSIAQKEKKPRSPAQIEAFQKARDKRLLLASQKKIDEAKRIESGVKTAKPKPAPAPTPKPVEPKVALLESVATVADEEEEVRVIKKPKKKRIIYVESDSEEELVVKRKGEKKELPPPPPPAEPIKLPPSKPKPLIVFL